MTNKIAYLKERTIIGSNINLYPISSTYALEMVRLRNQKRVKYFLSINDDLELKEQYNWIGEYLEKDNEVGYIIEDKKGVVVGLAFLYNYLDSIIELGRITFDLDKIMGKPYAIEACSTLLDLAFDFLGVELVTAVVKEDNPLVKFGERFGFTKEETKIIRENNYLFMRLYSYNRKYKEFQKYIDAWKEKLK